MRPAIISIARLESAAQDVLESNTCDRIEAGSVAAGSDVAAYLTTRQSVPYCLCCGHTEIEHTDTEWNGCQHDLAAWLNRGVR